jgi:site-specific DNA recombinase
MKNIAAIYVRVSTPRQAEKQLSIPDQIRQAQTYCMIKKIEIGQIFTEPGQTATDGNRPVFQTMINEALSKNRSFDRIIVHSFSRFYRESLEGELLNKKLKRNGVRVISITQDFADDPQGDMMRKIIGIYDEYSSKENAKHVLRSMKENTRQGFWNGGPPPYGYDSVTFAVRGDATKKKLEPNPHETSIVRRVFDLFEHGAGSGPLGVRGIAKWFAANGFRYRKGRTWSSSLVHTVLTNTSYKGEHYFNRRTFKTKELKDREEWVLLQTPIIIEAEAFDRVQAKLAARRPKETPPRVVNGPTLLTGRVKCESGAGMTLRTGKGGRYRYYTCQKHMNEGGCTCPRHSVPVAMLDENVIAELGDKILVPERLKALLVEIFRRASNKQAASTTDTKALDKELRVTEAKLDRLYTDRAEGVLSDTEMFKRKIAEYETQLRDITQRKAKADMPKATPRALLTSRNLERFTSAVLHGLTGENPAFKKALVNHLIDRILVRKDEIQLSGSKAALIAGLNSPEKLEAGGVPSFVKEWWAWRDSNPQPDRYERSALTIELQAPKPRFQLS